MSDSFQWPHGANRRQPIVRIRPKRTEELQLLYDRWKDSESCASSGSTLREIDDEGRKLQTPQSTALPSRTPSLRSFNSSASVYSNFTNDTSNRVRKQGRSGPLPIAKKNRTAFIRKLGACPTCQKRKVKCDHLDLTEFEEHYRLQQGSFLPYIQGAQQEHRLIDLTPSKDILRGISQSDDRHQYHFDYTLSAQDLRFSFSDDAISPNSMIHPASSLNDHTSAADFEVDMSLPTCACTYNWKGVRHDGTETYPGLEVQAQLSDHTPLTDGVVVQGNSSGLWDVPRGAPYPFEHWDEVFTRGLALSKCERCGQWKDALRNSCPLCTQQEGSSQHLSVGGIAGPAQPPFLL